MSAFDTWKFHRLAAMPLIFLLLILSHDLLAAPRVASASPSTVNLEPNKPVTIRISGTDLNLVRSAGVYSPQRVPVRDIAVDFRAMSAKEASIALTAGKAGLTGKFVLVLSDARGPIARVPVTISVAQTASNASQLLGSVPQTSGATTSSGASDLLPDTTRYTDTVRIGTPGALKLQWVKINDGATAVDFPVVDVSFGYTAAASEVCVNLLSPPPTTPVNWGPICTPIESKDQSTGVGSVKYDIGTEAWKRNYYPEDGRYAVVVHIKALNSPPDTMVSPLVLVREVRQQSGIVATGRPPLTSASLYSLSAGEVDTGMNFAPVGCGGSRPWITTDFNEGGVKTIDVASRLGEITALRVVCASGHSNSTGAGGTFHGSAANDIAPSSDPGRAAYNTTKKAAIKLGNMVSTLGGQGFTASCPDGFLLSGLKVRTGGHEDSGAGVVVTSGYMGGSLTAIESLLCTSLKTESLPWGYVSSEVPLMGPGAGPQKIIRCNAGDIVYGVKARLDDRGPGLGSVVGIEITCAPQIRPLSE